MKSLPPTAFTSRPSAWHSAGKGMPDERDRSFPWRLTIKVKAPADALGLSRRMIAYYSNGEKEVPKPILLACRGWESATGCIGPPDGNDLIVVQDSFRLGFLCVRDEFRVSPHTRRSDDNWGILVLQSVSGERPFWCKLPTPECHCCSAFVRTSRSTRDTFRRIPASITCSLHLPVTSIGAAGDHDQIFDAPVPGV